MSRSTNSCQNDFEWSNTMTSKAESKIQKEIADSIPAEKYPDWITSKILGFVLVIANHRKMVFRQELNGRMQLQCV